MPTTPSFTALDNEDGTTTVTITGGDSGAENVVYAAQVDNQWGDVIAWEEAGDRSGNGELDVTLTAGVWFLAVESTGDGSSVWTTPRYHHQTDGLPSILEQLLVAAEAKVRLMTLDGIQVSDRNSFAVIDELKVQNFNKPAVWIAAGDVEQHVPASVPVSLDGIAYPIVVALSDKANRDEANTHENRAKWSLWRQTIRRGFLSQRLMASPVPGFVTSIRPAPIIDRGWWDHNAFVSTQILTVQVNEERGLV